MTYTLLAMCYLLMAYGSWRMVEQYFSTISYHLYAICYLLMAYSS